MNTIKSVYYGWATLIVAGGGAYYFAKKQINADRAAKLEADHKKRIAQYELEQAHFNRNASPYGNPSPAGNVAAPSSIASEIGRRRSDMAGKEAQDKDWHAQADEASNPSQEASKDPAPTRHAPEDEAQKMREKSKYEASDVFRSRKGDRFS